MSILRFSIIAGWLTIGNAPAYEFFSTDITIYLDALRSLGWQVGASDSYGVNLGL